MITDSHRLWVLVFRNIALAYRRKKKSEFVFPDNGSTWKQAVARTTQTSERLPSLFRWYKDKSVSVARWVVLLQASSSSSLLALEIFCEHREIPYIVIMSETLWMRRWCQEKSVVISGELDRKFCSSSIDMERRSVCNNNHKVFCSFLSIVGVRPLRGSCNRFVIIRVKPHQGTQWISEYLIWRRFVLVL